MSRAVIIGGPNGAGKTTFAREFLPHEGGYSQFVNADLIARGLSPYAPETADVAAGRAMLRRLDELVGQNADFAIETTLSGKWLVERIAAWRRAGYEVSLIYVQVATPELAIERVRQRVAEGGHDVPETTIRRRFSRSVALFEATFKELVDHWIVYDNTGDTPAIIESSGGGG